MIWACDIRRQLLCFRHILTEAGACLLAGERPVGTTLLPACRLTHLSCLKYTLINRNSSQGCRKAVS